MTDPEESTVEVVIEVDTTAFDRAIRGDVEPWQDRAFAAYKAAAESIGSAVSAFEAVQRRITEAFSRTSVDLSTWAALVRLLRGGRHRPWTDTRTPIYPRWSSGFTPPARGKPRKTSKVGW